MPKTPTKNEGLSRKERLQVRKIVHENVDEKVHPIWQNVSVTAGTFGNTDLTNVALGSAIGDRENRKVVPRGLELNCYLTAGEANTMVRLMVVQWHPLNSSDGPDFAELFDLGAGSSYYPLNPYIAQQAQRKKFTVLYDQTHSMRAGYANGTKFVPIRVYNSLSSKRMRTLQYDVGTGSGIGAKNKLYLIYFSNNITSSNLIYQGQFKYHSGA